MRRHQIIRTNLCTKHRLQTFPEQKNLPESFMSSSKRMRTDINYGHSYDNVRDERQRPLPLTLPLFIFCPLIPSDFPLFPSPGGSKDDAFLEAATRVSSTIQNQSRTMRAMTVSNSERSSASNSSSNVPTSLGEDCNIRPQYGQSLAIPHLQVSQDPSLQNVTKISSPETRQLKTLDTLTIGSSSSVQKLSDTTVTTSMTSSSSLSAPITRAIDNNPPNVQASSLEPV